MIPCPPPLHDRDLSGRDREDGSPATAPPNGMRCFLCGGRDFDAVYAGTFAGRYQPQHVAITDHAYGLTGRIVCCRACAMVSVNPRPSAEELVGLYGALVDPAYEDEEEGRRVSFRRVLDAVARLGVPDRSVLDIGAGTGLFLDEARRRGFRASGVEPSHWAVARARERFGLDLIEGVLPNAEIPERSFGLVTMLDVIEHVDDPRQLVQEASRLLVDRGLLVVTTPDFGSLVRRALGQHWWHCRLAHVHYFTRATLLRLLRDCGFTIERVARYGWTFSLYYWMSRLESRPAVRRVLTWLESVPGSRRIGRTRVRMNFLDSMTIYARRGMAAGE